MVISTFALLIQSLSIGVGGNYYPLQSSFDFTKPVLTPQIVYSNNGYSQQNDANISISCYLPNYSLGDDILLSYANTDLMTINLVQENGVYYINTENTDTSNIYFYPFVSNTYALPYFYSFETGITRHIVYPVNPITSGTPNVTYFEFVCSLLPEYYYNSFVTGDSSSSDYQTGFDNGYNSGYTNGYQDGNSVGNREGREIGYQSGYTNGYNQGVNFGDQQGYQRGYSYGYEQGYNIGLTQSSADYGFGQLFGSIADTPILMLRRMFNFDLFGIPTLSIVLSLFTALIAIHIVKKVIK